MQYICRLAITTELLYTCTQPIMSMTTVRCTHSDYTIRVSVVHYFFGNLVLSLMTMS